MDKEPAIEVDGPPRALRLIDVGPNRGKVFALIRHFTGMSIYEAREAITTPGHVIATGPDIELRLLVDEYKRVGATVRIDELDQVDSHNCEFRPPSPANLYWRGKAMEINSIVGCPNCGASALLEPAGLCHGPGGDGVMSAIHCKVCGQRHAKVLPNGDWSRLDDDFDFRPKQVSRFLKGPPCPQCGSPLRSPLAKQCFSCGADWH